MDPYAEFQTTKELPEGAFADLNNLIRLMETRIQEVADAETRLATAQENLKSVSEHQIPAQLELMGLKEFVDSEGRKVKVVTKIRVSLPEAKKPAAFAWLQDNGHGGLIKRTVTVAFNRDQQAAATELAVSLQGKFAGVKQALKVEPATLSAFIKGQLEDGADFPEDVFKVFEQKTTKITQPKQ